MKKAELRRTERFACAEELKSLAAAHRACAVDPYTSAEMARMHRSKAETVEYCAQRLLDWGREAA